MYSKHHNKVKEVIQGRVNVHVGKSGVTEGVIKQIKNQLKSKKILKIKFLDQANFNSIDEAIEYTANKANAEVVDIRGKTCVLVTKK